MRWNIASLANWMYFGGVGRTFHFECPRCLYRTRVSGGVDSGFNCHVQTIICRDCRELYDVFTRLKQRGGPNPARGTASRAVMQPAGLMVPPLVVIENQLRVFKPGHRSKDGSSLWRWVEVKPCCPRAAYHRIEEWKDPGHCPRCGTFMEKNGFPYRLWD